jgi:hypothetical protein
MQKKLAKNHCHDMKFDTHQLSDFILWAVIGLKN